jgi:hypothetical protein
MSRLRFNPSQIAVLQESMLQTPIQLPLTVCTVPAVSTTGHNDIMVPNSKQWTFHMIPSFMILFFVLVEVLDIVVVFVLDTHHIPPIQQAWKVVVLPLCCLFYVFWILFMPSYMCFLSIFLVVVSHIVHCAFPYIALLLIIHKSTVIFLTCCCIPGHQKANRIFNIVLFVLFWVGYLIQYQESNTLSRVVMFQMLFLTIVSLLSFAWGHRWKKLNVQLTVFD